VDLKGHSAARRLPSINSSNTILATVDSDHRVTSHVFTQSESTAALPERQRIVGRQRCSGCLRWLAGMCQSTRCGVSRYSGPTVPVGKIRGRCANPADAFRCSQPVAHSWQALLDWSSVAGPLL